MTNPRIIKLSAFLQDINGEYTLKQLGLKEDATKSQIQHALFQIICCNIDWKWKEV